MYPPLCNQVRRRPIAVCTHVRTKAAHAMAVRARRPIPRHASREASGSATNGVDRLLRVRDGMLIPCAAEEDPRTAVVSNDSIQFLGILARLVSLALLVVHLGNELLCDLST